MALDAEALRIAIAPVTRTALPFFCSHGRCLNVRNWELGMRNEEFRITAVSPKIPQKNVKKANYKIDTETDRGLLAPDFFNDCLVE